MNIGVAIPKIQEFGHGDFGNMNEIHPVVIRDTEPDGTDAAQPPYIVSCEGFDLTACANEKNALPALDEIAIKIIDYDRGRLPFLSLFIYRKDCRTSLLTSSRLLFTAIF